MPQKQHVLLLFQNWHLSSNEAECTGGREAVAGTDKRAGGRAGGVRQGQRRLVEGTVWKTWQGGKDRRQGEKSGLTCGSLIFQPLKQHFATRPPAEAPLLGRHGERRGFSVDPGLYEACWATSPVGARDVWKRKELRLGKPETGTGPRMSRRPLPTAPPRG